MAHDHEEAVETECASVQKWHNDIAERYEATAQQARIRPVAEHGRRHADAKDE
jgi:hypothetical protein